MALKINNQIDAKNIIMDDGKSLDKALKEKQDELGKGGFIDSNNAKDLNELHTAGWYFCNFAYATNSPYTSGFGWLEIINQNENAPSCIQKAYRFNSSVGLSEIAIRPYTNNQWYPWRKVSTTTI